MKRLRTKSFFLVDHQPPKRVGLDVAVAVCSLVSSLLQFLFRMRCVNATETLDEFRYE